MRDAWSLFVAWIFIATWAWAASADAHPPRLLEHRLHHLRIDGPREWAEFPEQPAGPDLRLNFATTAHAGESCLRLRQQDVKQTWEVSLNGRALGQLVRDENDMVVYFSVPPNTLRDGNSDLVIRQEVRRNASCDDIRVGEIQLHGQPLHDLLHEAKLQVQVLDAATGQGVPARITIVNEDGALMTTGASSDDHLAVRPGIVYTSTGSADIGLPAGEYRLYAGRGFEYSLASADVTFAAGQNVRQTFTIRREVPTAHYVACDTHVHTLTHSGHGDATVEERMITLAAEGIELPIATDHNLHVDHEPFARQLNVRQYFTPVIGNEVTTRVGHFNIFPVRAGARVPDHTLTDWESLLAAIYRTPGVRIAILNHARDLHSGVRPFGPERFNGVVGVNLDGWAIDFNAMEVINSAATQTRPLELLTDWMALLNCGHRLTPVGSSDSHDVGRHFVGQGRTYIRCDDDDPGNIDVDEAVGQFLQGCVMVGYGLLAEIHVEGDYRSGETAPAQDETIQVAVRVLGPHWVHATNVALYANGEKIREAQIPKGALRDLPGGVKWSGGWSIDKPPHDVHLVAIATGPGIDGLYWPTAKPYQPMSPEWQPQIFGCSGAVWLDADGDGQPTPARHYAQRLFEDAKGDLRQLLAGLQDYDAAVAAQAAHLYQSSGQSLLTAEARQLVARAPAAAKVGFRKYLHAWRENQLARAGR